MRVRRCRSLSVIRFAGADAADGSSAGGSLLPRSAHYRSILIYRPSSLQEAATAIERVEAFLAATQEVLKPGREVPEAFAEAMDDDVNIPRALAVLHEQTRAGNAALAAGEDASDAANAVMAMAEVLGLRS